VSVSVSVLSVIDGECEYLECDCMSVTRDGDGWWCPERVAFGFSSNQLIRRLHLLLLHTNKGMDGWIYLVQVRVVEV